MARSFGPAGYADNIMLKHIGDVLLAVACGFGTVMVIGSILQQELQARPKLPKSLSPSVRPQPTVIAVAAPSQPRPVPPEPEKPKLTAPPVLAIPQPMPDEIAQRPKPKTPGERETLRAERAERLAKREERLRKQARRQNRQQESEKIGRAI